jgi:hypothetical protein
LFWFPSKLVYCDKAVISLRVINENDQQGATVLDNLLFLGCATCFERYFSLSSGASKLYLQPLVLYTWVVAGRQRLTCPRIIPEAVIHAYNTRGCKYSLNIPDDKRKYRSKHVEQPRNNKLFYTVVSCWSFSYIISRCTEPWILNLLEYCIGHQAMYVTTACALSWLI